LTHAKEVTLRYHLQGIRPDIIKESYKIKEKERELKWLKK